jgi:TP901 family phage tail tape measure protein
MPGAVATLIVRITSDLAQFNAGMSKASTRLAATSTKWASMGKSLTKGLTLPILAVGGIAVAAAMDVGKGMRIIQQRTGETGKAAESLGKSFKTVLKTVPESAEKVAEAMSQLRIKTGLVGKPLEDLTTQLLNLARITKSDVVETSTNAAKVFNNWAIATKDQGKALDYLYGVTTKTGIPINSLMGDLTRFGPQLRGVGFSFEASAALIGTFDKAGLQTSKVMMGLNAGLSKLAKAGKDPAVEFPKLITQIKNAGSASEATRLSVELFGTRGGPAMADAIRSGKVNFEDLIKTLKKTPISINKTAKETMTLGDRFKILKNKVSLALQPLGKGIMDAIKSILPIFSKLATVVGWIATAFSKIPGPIRTAIVIFLLMLAAVGPVLTIGAKFLKMASTMMKAFRMISSGFSALSSLLAANPIVLVVIAIVAIVVIAALLIKKYWKQIGPVLKKVWDGIKRAFDAVWPPIQRFLLAIWRPIAAFFKSHWSTIKTILTVVWKAIIIAAKVIWSVLKTFFTVLFKIIAFQIKVAVWVIRNIIVPVFKIIVATIKIIWNAVAGYFRFIIRIWKGIWNLGIAGLKLIWQGIKRAWHAVIDPLIRTVKAVWNAVSRAWSYVWGGKDGKGGISGAITGVWGALKKAWHTVMDPLIDTVKAIWDGVKAAWQTVWDGIVGAIRTSVNLIIDGVNLAIKAINLISPFKDIPKIPHWGEKKEKPQEGLPGSDKFNKTFLPWMHGGGEVSTTGGYRLRAGEGVLNPEAMRSMGTLNFMRANRGLAPAGGGASVSIGDIHLHSVSEAYDAGKLKRIVKKEMDDVARQGYHAGKLK